MSPERPELIVADHWHERSFLATPGRAAPAGADRGDSAAFPTAGPPHQFRSLVKSHTSSKYWFDGAKAAKWANV
jgi:hypothetical protein